MDIKRILTAIDHTMLKPQTTFEEIEQLANEAIEFGAASVCVPPYYVRFLRKNFSMLNICSVVGFPLGFSTLKTKVNEAAELVNDGANEVDMVINIAALKQRLYDEVIEEIAEIKKVSPILKVIVEACLLTEEEKIAACHCVATAKADFIKTSTGFSVGGATIEDILLFKKHLPHNFGIKAAGGINTIEQAEAFLDAGCTRIGSSKIIKEIKLGSGIYGKQ